MKASRTVLTLGLWAAAAFAVPTLDLRAPVTDCHKYVLVSARGTGEPQGHSSGFVNTIQWTLANATGGVEYDVVYPANTNAQSPAVGTADVLRYITSGMANCPSQKYALLGYSQGAMVVMNALKSMQGMPSQYAVEAVYTIGNPYQVPGQNCTFDQRGGDSTRNGTGTLEPSYTGVGITEEWCRSGKLMNICYSGDAVCNGANSFTMHSPLSHFQYIFDQTVQKMGANFLIDHLR